MKNLSIPFRASNFVSLRRSSVSDSDAVRFFRPLFSKIVFSKRFRFDLAFSEIKDYRHRSQGFFWGQEKKSYSIFFKNSK